MRSIPRAVNTANSDQVFMPIMGATAPSAVTKAPKKQRSRTSTNKHALGALSLYPDDDLLLPLKAVCAITSWSRTSINRLINEGRFPAPLKLGKSKIAFRESEIRAYVAAQLRRAGTRSI